MVRAGRGGRNFDSFQEHGLVAIGAERLGELHPTIAKSDLLSLYQERYPEKSEGHRLAFAGQILRFMNEVQVGDQVVTYDPDKRIYLVGVVSSECEWKPGLVDGAPRIRKVEWTHRVVRDGLSPATRNTLGSIMTLFRVAEEPATELMEKRLPLVGDSASTQDPPAVEPEVAPAGDDELRAEIVDKADEFIADRIARLSWDQMQHLIAGILRAMGYRTTISEAGPDRGVDIFASPDGLGLQEPRIFVEVKHRPTTPMGAQDLRAFLGGRKPGDRCLYVSTGGFTRDAKYEAERASVPLQLVTLPALRKLLTEHYELLDAESRALVPLKRLYWPID